MTSAGRVLSCPVCGRTGCAGELTEDGDMCQHRDEVGRTPSLTTDDPAQPCWECGTAIAACRKQVCCAVCAENGTHPRLTAPARVLSEGDDA